MKVFVYFNLHRKCWSIKALEGESKGRVIGHANYVDLADVTWKVSEKGRQRVIREKKKNVHAGAVGTLESATLKGGGHIGPLSSFTTRYTKRLLDADQKAAAAITYNPYRFASFVDRETEEPVRVSDAAFFAPERRSWAFPIKA